MTQTRRLRSILGLALLSLAMTALGGCYERVVRAEGMGTDNITVYEANLREDRSPIDDMEDAIFGEKTYGKTRRDRYDMTIKKR
jgi:hypothetical protein